MISICSVRARAAITALLLLSGTAMTWADTPPPVHRELSKETREKMAALHEQMAACLRSDKSLAECHSMMIQGCWKNAWGACLKRSTKAAPAAA